MPNQVKTLETKGVKSAYVTGEPGDEKMKEGVKAGRIKLCSLHQSYFLRINIGEDYCAQSFTQIG